MILLMKKLFENTWPGVAVKVDLSYHWNNILTRLLTVKWEPNNFHSNAASQRVCYYLSFS